MNSSKHRFSLDMHSHQSQISIPALLGDSSRSLYISFTDGGNPYFIEDGCLAKISIKRPTGTFLEEFCDIENNTTVVYHFSQNKNTCAVEGIHDCDVVLYGADGGQIASPRFTMVVSERVIRTDDINISDEDKTAIDNIIQVEAARVVAESARVKAEAARVDAENNREAVFDATIGKLLQGELPVAVSKITEVTLLASAWSGNASLYSQVVDIEDVTENTKVDLLPSVEQLAIFHKKDLAFVTENDDGVVTVYAIGDKPTTDYPIQVSLTEVKA